MQSGFSGQHSEVSGYAREYQVEVTTLGDALRPDERPVDFIKCDAEGAEMTVLRGAADLLRDDKPFLVLEAEMPNVSGLRPRVQEFARFLEPLGYQGLSFDYDGELKVVPLGSLVENHANVAFIHNSKV